MVVSIFLHYSFIVCYFSLHHFIITPICAIHHPHLCYTQSPSVLYTVFQKKSATWYLIMTFDFKF